MYLRVRQVGTRGLGLGVGVRVGIGEVLGEREGVGDSLALVPNTENPTIAMVEGVTVLLPKQYLRHS